MVGLTLLGQTLPYPLLIGNFLTHPIMHLRVWFQYPLEREMKCVGFSFFIELWNIQNLGLRFIDRRDISPTFNAHLDLPFPSLTWLSER